MILSTHQQSVFESLVDIARVATDGSRSALPIIPRCHSLIVGSSGSGKSYLAKSVANEMQLPCFSINVATWILTASRNEPSTWTQLLGWLASLSSGGVVVLDEIDKCNGTGEYIQSVRLEIHDLLDGVIPKSAKLPEPAPDFLGKDFGTTVWHDRDTLGVVLRERVMIIACGAWQSAWISNKRSMGFGEQTTPGPPTASQLSVSIDPELRQRFRDQICFLPPILPAEYVVLAQRIGQKIPSQYRDAWESQSESAIHKAVEGNLGMRIFEELLLSAMLTKDQPRTASS